MDQTAHVPHKISNVEAGFMIAVALILDGIQFLFTLFVITSFFSILVTVLAICIFGVWFAIHRVNYFSGRKTGAKILSVFGSMFVELVPLIDGLPAITAGVIGIIVSTRLEERSARKAAGKGSGGGRGGRVRFSAQKLPE